LRVLSSKWFIFEAKGHRNVKALHETTFEVTKDDYLTPRGDCIIGIESEASASDMPEWLKNKIRAGGLVVVILCSEGVCDSVVGLGDPRMSLSDTRRMVFRRSNFVGPETVMIRASKAAKDLSRALIERLRNGSKLMVALTALEI